MVEDWSDERWREIGKSATRATFLQTITNTELSSRLLSVWMNTPINTEASDVISEAVDRLKVWDEPPAAIRERIEAAIDKMVAKIRSDKSWKQSIESIDIEKILQTKPEG